MAEPTTVNGFFVEPTNNDHTITSPEAFGDFVIDDDVLISRGERIVTRARVVDIITRQSNGHSSLVLSGINRRSVKQDDTIESLQNAISRRTPVATEVTLPQQ